MKQEITSRQFAIMVALSILTFKLTYLPSFLFAFAGKDGFWAFLISLFVDLLTFFIIIPIFLKKETKRSLRELHFTSLPFCLNNRFLA